MIIPVNNERFDGGFAMGSGSTTGYCVEIALDPTTQKLVFPLSSPP